MVLFLQNNQLFGPLPDLVGYYDLRTLQLSGNNFTGGIPNRLYSARDMTDLDVSSNRYVPT